MKVSHPLLSGVLIPAICVVISMPLFVSASPSPVPVESRESVVSYQPPIEEVAPGGMENQYQQQLLRVLYDKQYYCASSYIGILAW